MIGAITKDDGWWIYVTLGFYRNFCWISLSHSGLLLGYWV